MLVGLSGLATHDDRVDPRGTEELGQGPVVVGECLERIPDEAVVLCPDAEEGAVDVRHEPVLLVEARHDEHPVSLGRVVAEDHDLARARHLHVKRLWHLTENTLEELLGEEEANFRGANCPGDTGEQAEETQEQKPHGNLWVAGQGQYSRQTEW